MAFHQDPTPPADPVRKPRDWRRGLPDLVGATVTLRPLRLADAPALLSHLSDPLVQEYLSPCPTSVEGVRRVHLLPYHRTAVGKLGRLGMPNPLPHVESPAAELMERAAEPFRRLRLDTRIGG